MVLHIYHATIGEKEFQFSTEINKLNQETYEVDVKKAIEEVSSSLLEHLSGEDAQCCACKSAAAVRLIHHTMLFDQTFPPRVEDLPQPVCAAENCEAVARASYMMDMEDVTTSQGLPSSNGCFRCGKKQQIGMAPLQRCSRCKVAKYCSVDCQRADWRIHKQVCLPVRQ